MTQPFALPPLPEPNADLIVGDWRLPEKTIPLYAGATLTAAQVTAYTRQSVDAALEAAAPSDLLDMAYTVAEWHGGGGDECGTIARDLMQRISAIRSMKAG